MGNPNKIIILTSVAQKIPSTEIHLEVSSPAQNSGSMHFVNAVLFPIETYQLPGGKKRKQGEEEMKMFIATHRRVE